MSESLRVCKKISHKQLEIGVGFHRVTGHINSVRATAHVGQPCGRDERNPHVWNRSEYALSYVFPKWRLKQIRDLANVKRGK